MKIAVVTGTSYGLGKSICEALLRNSFKVYGISRTKPNFTSDNFRWIKADLYNQLDITNIAGKITEEKIDLLVNNAGTHREEPALHFSQENFHKIFDLNFVAPIHVASTLSSKLHNSLIINISSTSDRFAEKNSGLYCASKSALNMYFDALALENKYIKVLTILPDYVDTPLQHKVSDSVKNFDWEKCVQPDDIANFICDIMNEKYDLERGTRVIVVNNKAIDATRDPEKLFYFNVDTKELKKLK